MAKRKEEETNNNEEIKEVNTSESGYLCPNCRFFINNRCEHYSNIKIIIKKRIEKKVYISLNQKAECKYVQPKA